MSMLLFYERPVALNRETHKRHKVKGPSDYKFAAKTNSVVLAGTEFFEAQKNYPIVFTRNNDAVVPVAVLGIRDQENLFVDSEGHWADAYLPAFVRRYPFVLANRPEDADQLMICVEESALNKRQGKALFTKEGEESDYLKRATEFMQQYHIHFQKTREFGQRLKDLGLLQPMSARITLPGSSDEMVLGQFEVVNEQALRELSPEDIHSLFDSGFLGWIYAHLISLSNFQQLTRRVQAAAAA